MAIVKLWKIRNYKGYSLRKLADRCGISKTTLNDVENGKLSPTLDELERIAAALGCSICELFDSPHNKCPGSRTF